MPTARPGAEPGATRRPRTADVRAALVESAWWVLEHQGPAGLTIRAVANRAGVAPMGVYNHLRDKDGLLRAVLHRGFDELTATLDAARGGDPTEAFADAGRAYRRFAVAHPVAYTLMFHGERRRVHPPGTADIAAEPDEEERELLAAGAQAFGRLVAVIELGQAAGSLRAGPPERLAWAAWSAVHGAVSLELAGGLDGESAEQGYEDVVAMISRGLAPDPRAAG